MINNKTKKSESEGARQISGGKLFQSRGAAAEKAQFLFFLSGPLSASGPSAVFPGYGE